MPLPPAGAWLGKTIGVVAWPVRGSRQAASAIPAYRAVQIRPKARGSGALEGFASQAETVRASREPPPAHGGSEHGTSDRGDYPAAIHRQGLPPSVARACRIGVCPVRRSNAFPMGGGLVEDGDRDRSHVGPGDHAWP